MEDYLPDELSFNNIQSELDLSPLKMKKLNPSLTIDKDAELLKSNSFQPWKKLITTPIIHQEINSDFASFNILPRLPVYARIDLRQK
jgi:hypothetical protein